MKMIYILLYSLTTLKKKIINLKVILHLHGKRDYFGWSKRV